MRGKNVVATIIGALAISSVSAACAPAASADECDAFVRRSSLYFSPEEAEKIRTLEDAQRLFPDKLKIGNPEVIAHCKKAYAGLQQRLGPDGLREYLRTAGFHAEEGEYRKDYISYFKNLPPPAAEMPMTITLNVGIKNDGTMPSVRIHYTTI